MKRLLLTLLLCLPLHAHAVLITSSAGDQYDVSTITGTWSDLSAQLMATPWWGDGLLAGELSGLFTGAKFVILAGAAGSTDPNLAWYEGSGANGCSNPTCYDTSDTWAIGSEVVASVSEPGSLGLLAAALVALGLVRRRKPA